ncbi:MAG: TonB-dependent receptor [Dysgonamonadaceae bacterium]|nr:TonB-dependent receptor [Dysgonamonadaceae bacterium]
MIHLHKVICVCICLFVCHTGLCGQEKTDTIRVHTLREVDVKGEKRPPVMRSTSPVQVLKGVALEKLGALQVSDAAKFFSGVQIKDYGGVGGLKTISIRGLGSAHSLVVYDGVAVSDYQTGQIDIGRFSPENIEMLSLHIGESDELLRSARDLSAAGSLSMTTRRLTGDGEKRKLVAGVKGGSFGLFNPSASYEQMLSKSFSAQVSGEWMQTDGNYPYTTAIGEKRIRENSTVRTFNTEVNLRGDFSNGGHLHFKIYGYDSDRSLPGAYRFYTTYPGEQVRDKTLFSQAVYEQKLLPALHFRSALKFNFNHTCYTPLDAQVRYLYYQREYYATATLLYEAGKYFSLSWANDGSFSNFRKNFFDKKPERTMWQSAVSAKYQREAFTANGSILGTYTHNRIQSGETKDLSDFSPCLGFSVKPLPNSLWRIRGFYKQTYRQPTFGDLYSVTFGSRNLRPEKADQYNLGMTWAGTAGKHIPYLSLTADAYWNRIRDKIVFYPTSSMYLFTILNLGKVDIKGVDLRLSLNGYINDRFSYQLQASYSRQQALDRTNPESPVFNHQIVYTPEHAAAGYAALLTPWLNVNCTFLFSGERYFNTMFNRMDAYSDNGISLDRTFQWRRVKIKFSVECLNLFDESYEIVRSYPMPGRSFRTTFKIVY